MDNMIPKSNTSVAVVDPFIEVIRTSMSSFGDSPEPLTETAVVIEEFVKDQLNRILFKASQITEMRGAIAVGYEDLIFLMRGNPVKVQRLVKFLAACDSACSSSESVDQSNSDITRVERVKAFIDKIETGGKLKEAANLELFDSAQAERQKRLESLSRTLEGRKYLEFAKESQVRFINDKARNQKRFYNWITKGVQNLLIDLKIEKNSLEILSYLAYETLGQIVELSLLIKKDSSGQTDSLDKLSAAPAVVNPQYPNIQLNGIKAREDLDLDDSKVSKNHKSSLQKEHVLEAIRRLQNQCANGVFEFGQQEHCTQNNYVPLLAI